MRPSGAARRRRAQNGERRRHEIRQSRARGTPVVVLGAFLAAFLRCSRTTPACTRLRTFARARTPWSGVAFCRAGLDVVFDAFVRMPNPLAALAFSDLGNRAAADRRQRLVLRNFRIIRAPRFPVPRFVPNPLLPFFPRPALHAQLVPSPLPLLPLPR